MHKLVGFIIREGEAAFNGSRGQSPIHPSILAKTLLFAMIRRIRSSRQIQYKIKHSIDFMWLTSGRQIDHTTLSEFRRKHSDALRGIFKQMILLAINLGRTYQQTGCQSLAWSTKRYEAFQLRLAGNGFVIGNGGLLGLTKPNTANLFYNWINYLDDDGGGRIFGVTGWGAHAYDQIQNGLRASDTGPVSITLLEPVQSLKRPRERSKSIVTRSLPTPRN